MKALFLCFSLAIAMGSTPVHASVKTAEVKPVIVGVLADVPRAEFADKVQILFQTQWENCSSCEIKNLTPYDEKGIVDRSALVNAVENSTGQVQVLFLFWNEPANGANQKFIDALKKAVSAGEIVIGPAGEPVAENPALALSRTVLGQVPDAIIVGDLNEREGLLRRSFYGPEMLTALKPSKDLSPGTGLASSLFAARLAREWNKKTQAEWISHFRAKKSASRRIWPGIDEFFGR